MARPKNPPEAETVPFSARFRKSGVRRIDEIADHRGTNRTEAAAALLGLGIAAWDRGARPPIKRTTSKGAAS